MELSEEQLVEQGDWDKTLLVYILLTIFAIAVGRELINFVFVGLTVAMLSYAYVSQYMETYRNLVITMIAHSVALFLWIYCLLVPVSTTLRIAIGLAALVLIFIGIPLLNRMKLKSISGRYYVASAMLIVMLVAVYVPIAKLIESPLLVSVLFTHAGLIIFYAARGMALAHDMDPPQSPSYAFKTPGLMLGLIAIMIDGIFLSLVTVALST